MNVRWYFKIIFYSSIYNCLQFCVWGRGGKKGIVFIKIFHIYFTVEEEKQDYDNGIGTLTVPFHAIILEILRDSEKIVM